jgi:uncharacterized membrane protein (TIGR02234 family)
VNVSGRPAAVLTAGIGAGALLLASGRVWVHATVQDAVQNAGGPVPLATTGREAQPLVLALALVAAAAAVALLIAGRWARVALGCCLLLAGAGAAAAAIAVLADPASAVRSPRSGLVTTAGGVHDVQVTAWPWLAVAAGLVLVAAGVLTLVAGRRWAGANRRFDREGATPSPQENAPEVWDALSRGEDPTAPR